MHDLGRWHFHLQSPGIRRCNNECVALWFIMAVPNSWAVYRFPRLCPNFPLAEAEEGPGAMMHVARVFFQRGHHSIGPAGEAVACCQCINPLQKHIVAREP